MAYDLATLTTIRDNYVAQELAASASWLPSYSIDGQAFQRKEYLEYLSKRIAELNAQIDAFGGGWVESFGY